MIGSHFPPPPAPLGPAGMIMMDDACGWRRVRFSGRLLSRNVAAKARRIPLYRHGGSTSADGLRYGILRAFRGGCGKRIPLKASLFVPLSGPLQRTSLTLN